MQYTFKFTAPFFPLCDPQTQGEEFIDLPGNYIHPILLDILNLKYKYKLGGLFLFSILVCNYVLSNRSF